MMIFLTPGVTTASQAEIWTSDGAYKMKGGWDAEERAQINEYYFPVSPDYHSTHWHDATCCESHRCFTARPGSVEFTPNGNHVEVRMPDGRIERVARDSKIWKERKDAGLLDSRFDMCFEKDSKNRWQLRCGYMGQALY